MKAAADTVRMRITLPDHQVAALRKESNQTGKSVEDLIVEKLVWYYQREDLHDSSQSSE
jgi:hypothetical protein